MKRIAVLVLILSLLLSGCSCSKDPTNTSEPTASTAESTQETTQEATKPTPGESGTYRHPLTGMPLDAPWSGQVTAVVINNLKAAMPQHGISQADIFYEVEVEGDITRCLAIFTDLSSVSVIGPIRSARTYYNSLAVSYDAPLVHCGGSPGLALAGRYGATADTIANWEHIDQADNGKYFYRDKDRQNSGYSYEHTLFTKGELLQQAMDAKGYNTPTDKTFGLQFDDSVTLKGDNAEEIKVKFKSGKVTTFVYSESTQNYKMIQHGKDNVDGNTGNVVTFKNVIAIYTNQWYHSDGTHKFYDTIGSGKGYAAINGKIVPILWSRESLRSPYTYTLEDGTPLILEAGNSYIALVGIKHEIAYK